MNTWHGKKSGHAQWIKNGMTVWLVILNTLVLYTLGHTSWSFHSAGENAAAFVLTVVCVGYPLKRAVIDNKGCLRKYVMVKEKQNLN